MQTGLVFVFKGNNCKNSPQILIVHVNIEKLVLMY